MSDTMEATVIEDGQKLVQHDPIEEGIQDALARAEKTIDQPLPASVAETIASKIAGIIDGMEGIKRNHNGRYPSHSIDQVVSAVSPLVSAAGLRIKTEVLDIDPFAVLRDMPFWREVNGKQEMYKRDVHLFNMALRFLIIDGATGEVDAHHWTHVFEIGRAEQDQSCGSAVSYATKDCLKRQFMIADDSDDPDFKGGGQRIDLQALDCELVPIHGLVPNERQRSDKQPGWYAVGENDQIRVALWEISLKAIETLMRWNSGTLLKLLGENENRYQFHAPLMLRVSANQYGLNLARDGQLNSLQNPAVAHQFMYTAKQIIPGLTAEQAAEYLDVEQIEDFEDDMGAALQIIQTAKRLVAAGSDGDSSQQPPATHHRASGPGASGGTTPADPRHSDA